MAGYWPSSFLSFLLTKTKLRSIKVRKKTKPIYSRIVQTCLVNTGFTILPKRELFIGGPMQEILGRQDGSILPAQAANQSTEFTSTCLLTDSAIQ